MKSQFPDFEEFFQLLNDHNVKYLDILFSSIIFKDVVKRYNVRYSQVFTNWPCF